MPSFPKISLAFISALFVSSLSFASTNAEELGVDALQLQRQIYQDNESQRYNVNSKSYQRIIDKLENYPLLPYFQQKQLRRNLALRNEDKIREFLETYNGTPVSFKLRAQWLDHLYISNKQNRFMQYYQPNLSNKLSCIAWQYQLKDGQNQDAIFNEVSKVWLSAKSQPDECDPVFKQWQEAGYQSVELTWQRMMMARQKRQYLLAKYLRKQLPKEEQYLLDLYKSIRQAPKRVAHLDKFKKQNLQEGLVLSYGLKRLVWQDEKLALAVFKKVQKQNRLTEAQRKSILSRLTVAAARSEESEVIRWYQSLSPALISDSAKQWQLAKELSEQDYSTFLNQLQQMSAEEQKDRQWRYWETRAKQKVNPDLDVSDAYQRLGKERSYYGFLAAARVGQQKSLNHQPLKIEDDLLNRLAQEDGARRAFELFAIEQLTPARREWDFWLRSLTEDEKLAAVQLAHNVGWHSQGIASLGKMGVLNDTDIRFPQPHQAIFNKFAKQYKVDVAWAYAIARKESIFMEDARSSVGALGLMQLMPNTAKNLAKKKLNNWNILQIDTNVKLGIQYLKQLLNRFDNNIVLATAAYNAGPGNVNKWLKAQPKLPADEWIETIPFKETRNYVKSVLAYTEIYQQKYHKGASPFKQLMTMEID